VGRLPERDVDTVWSQRMGVATRGRMQGDGAVARWGRDTGGCTVAQSCSRLACRRRGGGASTGAGDRCDRRMDGGGAGIDRPGIGAPGHLFKSAQVATCYNVFHYITTSSHEGYCWPEQLAKRDIMCLEPLERCWTTILVND
jgi:hypothetical protein